MAEVLTLRAAGSRYTQRRRRVGERVWHHRDVIDLVLINGLPGSGKTTLARGLESVLGTPLISKDAIKEAVAEIVPAAPGQALGMAADW